MSARTHRSRVRERGASLVELMVGVAVGLLILSVLLVLFANTSRSRSEIQRTSDALENGRYALELLSENLQLAGFYGELAPAAAPPSPLPDACSLDPAVWDSAIPLHLQGHTDASGIPSCIPATRIAATDVLTVRRVRPCIAGSAGCDAVVAGEAYLQVGMCSTTPQPYELGISGGATFALREKNCTSAASLRKYEVHTYFVSSTNATGQAVPTLKRMELANGAMSEIALVEGVEQLRFEYGMDTNADGAADVFTPDPHTFTYSGCAACTPEVNWTNVVTVKVHVLVRSSEPTLGHVDAKTYTLGRDAAGAAVTVGPFNDGYRRHVYSGVVRLMNPSARREAP